MNVNDDLDTANEKLSAYEVYCARKRLAKDQAVLFPTQLAMARWRSGLTCLRGGQAPLRAAWHARIVRDYQAWLERGGFAQHDEQAPLRKPVMWQPPQPSLTQRQLQVLQQQSQSYRRHGSQQHAEPPCRSDRDGDARPCGTCT